MSSLFGTCLVSTRMILEKKFIWGQQGILRSRKRLARGVWCSFGVCFNYLLGVASQEAVQEGGFSIRSASRDFTT